MPSKDCTRAGLEPARDSKMLGYNRQPSYRARTVPVLCIKALPGLEAHNRPIWSTPYGSSRLSSSSHVAHVSHRVCQFRHLVHKLNSPEPVRISGIGFLPAFATASRIRNPPGAAARPRRACPVKLVSADGIAPPPAIWMPTPLSRLGLAVLLLHHALINCRHWFMASVWSPSSCLPRP